MDGIAKPSPQVLTHGNASVSVIKVIVDQAEAKLNHQVAQAVLLPVRPGFALGCKWVDVGLASLAGP